MVTVSFGAIGSDPRRHPLVIALLTTADVEPSMVSAMAKEAVGQGADLIALPVGMEHPDTVGMLATGAVDWVGVATEATGFARLVAAGATAIWWRGDGPPPDRGTGSRAETVPVMAGDARGLHAGDALVGSGADASDAGSAPPGLPYLVDLTGIDSRAVTAAAVTVGLENGAVGFITTLPRAVRRAAHVIRAVEHAE